MIELLVSGVALSLLFLAPELAAAAWGESFFAAAALLELAVPEPERPLPVDPELVCDCVLVDDRFGLEFDRTFTFEPLLLAGVRETGAPVTF
ncbi:MAG: hypothetical protein ACRDKI_12305 [Solirubrobacterales bacterium]